MIPELITILDDLKKVARQQNLNISDDILFEQGCSFLRGELASQNRYGRLDWDKEKKQEVKKASDKQIAYIQSLADKKGKDVKISKDLTYIEASKMIEELKNGN